MLRQAVFSDPRKQNTRNAVQIVLAHLCSELDESTFILESNEDENLDDAAVLEEMIFSEATENIPEIRGLGGDSKSEKIDIFSVHVEFAPRTEEF